MTLLNTKRHDALFDRRKFALPITLFGLGGVGSEVGRQLAKLGCGTHEDNVLNFWDGDRIEPHNPSNQVYHPHEVGRHKADVLGEHFTEASGGRHACVHPHFVREKIPLRGVVIHCLDTMQDRKDINETSVWRNPDVKVLIETRMDAQYVVVFTVDPNNEKHIEKWNDYWFPDEEAENRAGCGGHLSIINTVVMTASVAVEQFRVFASRGTAEGMYNHIRINLKTWETVAHIW